MEPDLLGYLLNALDAPARAAVADHLQANPAARARLAALRQTLEPLQYDTAAPPPRGLAERTIALVAAQANAKAPSANWHGVPWRRVAQTAAVFLLIITASGLAISWIGRLYHQVPDGDPNAPQVLACKNNLHQAFVALRAYSDAHHRQFPNAAAQTELPAKVPDVVLWALKDSNLLPADVQLACSAAGIPSIYAYSLGYRQAGQLVGLTLGDGKPSSQMPLMADSSPHDPLAKGQSVSHGGTGQNVLFCDGHVRFTTSRNVGVNLDDIYLNRANKVAAGIDWSDAVLSSGTVQP